ncbi:MAG: hypothetical protein VBE63_08285 [Lamprobacter sp.]|uniref:hypothetical protein n=1 Tax=Lamprobacter sp. TaxID=3100796 RepID=UPI002B25F6C3|nr:hypothetical protein [Lamprobacter sp.]MEA3639927.1 hypothetical protein [Lamprobacter sp.]
MNKHHIAAAILHLLRKIELSRADGKQLLTAEEQELVDDFIALLDKKSAPEKPLPDARYLCADCYEDYSWSAAQLYWSNPLKDWYCEGCFSCGLTNTAARVILSLVGSGWIHTTRLPPNLEMRE